MEETNEQKNSENGNSKYVKWIFYGIVFIAIIIFKAGAKKDIRENAIEEAFQNAKTKTSVSEQEQIWFTNTQHGLVFETPKPIKEVEATIPQGTEEGYSAVYSYVLKENDMVITYNVMDTYFETYNTKIGLETAIKNLASITNSSNLELDFTKGNGEYNSHTCTGSLYFQGNRMLVRGFSLFKEGKVYVVIGTGEDKETVKRKLNRIFNSIYINF